MSRFAQSSVSPQPSLGSAALTGLLAQVVSLFPGFETPVALTWLAIASAYVGRRAGVLVGGRLVYPNLHVGITPWSEVQATLHAALDFFRYYYPEPHIIAAGVRDATSLTHLVRDPVVRAERLQSAGRTYFTDAAVDGGESEKRLVVVQPMHSLIRTKTAGATSLVSAMMAAFHGGELRVHLPGGVTGYWLTSTSPHIALISNLTEENLASVISGEMQGGMSHFVCVEADLGMAQIAFDDVLHRHFPAALGIDAAAEDILDAALLDLGWWYPLADLKLAKIAAIYAMTDCEDRIGVDHARAAAAVVKYSAALAQWRNDRDQLVRDTEKVAAALSRFSDGLDTSQLLRKVRMPASDLHQVLDSLMAAGRVLETLIPTSGKTRKVYTLR